jgi:phage shock protein PspC (stress-responsive transcriptional regulator)
MLGGVCGGLGEYYRLDPTLMRLIVIVLTFLLPFMFLVYLLLWIIIPAEPAAPSDEVLDTQAKE